MVQKQKLRQRQPITANRGVNKRALDNLAFHDKSPHFPRNIAEPDPGATALAFHQSRWRRLYHADVSNTAGAKTGIMIVNSRPAASGLPPLCPLFSDKWPTFALDKLRETWYTITR
jgi:hypothetical protein